MPQFDLSSFFVQYFWLIISLAVIYPLLCIYFLPVTCKYIKSRRRLLATPIPKTKSFYYLSLKAENLQNHIKLTKFLSKTVIF